MRPACYLYGLKSAHRATPSGRRGLFKTGAHHGGFLARPFRISSRHAGGHARFVGRTGQYLEISRIDGRARGRILPARVCPFHAGGGTAAHDSGTAHRAFDAFQRLSGIQVADPETLLVGHRRSRHRGRGHHPELLFRRGGLGFRLHSQGHHGEREHAGPRRGEQRLRVAAREPVAVAVLAVDRTRGDGVRDPAGRFRRHRKGHPHSDPPAVRAAARGLRAEPDSTQRDGRAAFPVHARFFAHRRFGHPHGDGAGLL